MDEKLETILSLKDEFSDKMDSIIDSATRAKKQLERVKPVIDARDKVSPKVSKIRSILKRLKDFKSKVDIKANDKASDKVKRIRRNLLKLKAKAIGVSIMDKTSGILDRIWNRIRRITSKKHKAKIGEEGSKSLIGKLKNIKLLLSGIAAGAVVKLGMSAIKSGAELEQQKVAMEHFMGVGNPNMGKVQTHRATQQYVRQLRANANATPYETPEVIAAGQRALTISGGNSRDAMKLLKISEDMAASDPNKSLSDAIEAIADMKMGEFERMKEFGFKGSKEAFDKAGGNMFNMKSADGKTLSQLFGGLAEKHANTGAGMFSTIMGNVNSAKQDLGMGMLEGLKPQMAKIRDVFQNLLGNEDTSNKIAQFGQKIGDVLSKVIDIATRAGGFIKDLFEGFKSSFDGEMFSGLMSALEKFFGYISVAAPVVSVIFKAFGLVIGGVFTAIAFVVRTFFEVLNGIFSAIGIVVKGAQDMWGRFKAKVHEVFSSIRTKISSAMATARGAINSVRGVVDSVKKKLDSFGEAWQRLKTRIANNPIVATIRQVGDAITGGGSGDSGGSVDALGRRHAFGQKRVPYNEYPAKLHEGERVLTKNEANKYERREKQSSGNIVININRVDARDKTDVDYLVGEIVRKLKLAQAGGV